MRPWTGTEAGRWRDFKRGPCFSGASVRDATGNACRCHKSICTAGSSGGIYRRALERLCAARGLRAMEHGGIVPQYQPDHRAADVIEDGLSTDEMAAGKLNGPGRKYSWEYRLL